MDDALDLLAAWMPKQRWYAGKGRVPALTVVGAYDLPNDDDTVTLRSLLVRDDSSSPATLYQVPLTRRSTTDLPPEHTIGTLDDGTVLGDGPHDELFARALLRLIEEGSTAIPHGVEARGEPTPGRPPLKRSILSARVLSGEQSNTSIIFHTDDGTVPVIVKVFRAVHHGDNPDVILQSALSAAGTDRVPACVGSVAGSWPDSARPDGARGQFAFAQEFLPGTEDAWRVALRSAAAGEDFADGARELGAATAEVHGLLAELFVSRATTETDTGHLVSSWEQRLATAVAEVPELEPYREPILAGYDHARSAPWPALQRIHGDYHLGQVLRAPDRGWVLLDFEGEPLRPMSERDQPDIALRDVAGMLRSFDYVAGSVRLDQTADEQAVAGAERWAARAREAFLDGYSEVAGSDVRDHSALLAAFEIDKAVYEAVYEARNRPTWVPIPVQAIQRLVDLTA